MIDGGIDLHKPDPYFNGRVLDQGLGYYPRQGNSESPLVVFNGGHGTIMASMIRRIKPWVSLHAMKLQEGPFSDSDRTIFAESVVNAIDGAMKCKVDVISISWTIKHKMD